jgi:amino acid transporter
MSYPPSARPGGALVRVVGVTGFALTALNVTVGVGIFGLPALIAAGLGPAAPLAYLICGLLIALMALCMAELGSRVPEAGGLYACANSALGPLAGSVVGTLMWFGNGVLSNAAVAVLFAATLGRLMPSLATPAYQALIITSVYTVLVAINVRGVRLGVEASVTLSVIKLVPLVVLLVAGLPEIDASNLRIHELPAPGQVAQTSVLLFFAFMGAESALGVCGEVRDPERVVPRGLIIAAAATTALYLGLQTVAQGVLGDALREATDAPLADAAQKVFGPVGLGLIAIATALSGAGLLSGDLLASPRALFAMGRDGLLPARLGAVHQRYRSPHLAIITYGVVCWAMALTGTFRTLAILSSGGTLMAYLISCVGLLRLRRRGIGDDRRPFILPGGATIPMIVVAAVIVLLASLQPREMLALVAMVVIGAIPWLCHRRFSSAGGALEKPPSANATAEP